MQKRDIRLECPPQKKLGSWLRRAALPPAAKAVRQTQFGSGFNNGSTEMAYLVQAASEGPAETWNLPSITLYADIASAFAEVQRCLVVVDMASRSTLKAALVSYGLSPDLAEGIVGDVADTGFWKQNGASEHLVQMLEACLDNIFSSF